jgi:hypothetical protein
MGDGIMALFGAPIAHEDHAVRACYAALRMQASVSRYAEEARRAHGATVQIRVGLNSGEVVVRAIGNDLRMDYTAVGETTHLAARMEQAARPGTVLIAPATLDLVEGLVAVTCRGPMPVKGRREPVEVYELSGIGPARSRLQAAARRGLTRFAGRGAEIEALRRALEQAPSWARPVWENPAFTGSSRGRPTPTAGSCSGAAPSPMRGAPRTCPSSSCWRTICRSRGATIRARFASVWRTRS